MRIDLSAYDCVDFGCSGGGSIAFCKEELGGQRILGLDLDPKKVDAARAAGFDAEVADLSNPALEYTGTVRFVTMSHFLEHLPGRKEAQRCIETACRIADEFVFIRQPYFDADSCLFSLRLKLYWSDWSVHPYHMTSLDFYEMLRKLVEEDKIARYVIFFRSQIEDSHDTAIHPISSPPLQHQWEVNTHDSKPFHGFPFPVFRETGAIILTGSESMSDQVRRWLLSCTIIYDSDNLLDGKVGARIKELNRRMGEGEATHKRVTTLETRLSTAHTAYSWRMTAPLRAVYAGLRRAPGNVRGGLRQLRWLGTSWFSRAVNGLLPLHRRLVPARIRAKVPPGLRRAVNRRLLKEVRGARPKAIGEQEQASHVIAESFLGVAVTERKVNQAMATLSDLLSLNEYGIVWDDGERPIPELWELHPRKRATRFGLLSLYEFAARFVDGKRVLDFGCGVGYGSYYLLSRGAKAVTAIDVDSRSMRYAKDRYKHPALHFIETSIEDLSQSTKYVEAFDFVCCSNVMEHIPDYRSALRAVTRLLAPDGLYLQVTPPSGEAQGNPWHITNLTVAQWRGVLSQFFCAQTYFAHIPCTAKERTENQFDFQFVQCEAHEMGRLKSISGIILCKK